jgi:hypothetical protein
MHAALPAFAVLALAAGETGEPRSRLEVHVTHGSDTAMCPDETALRARLSAAETGVDGAVRLDVHFERAGARAYRAVVRVSGARSGVRTLDVAGQDCGPLVEALTVSMMLFLDPQASSEPSPENTESSRGAQRPSNAESSATIPVPPIFPKASRSKPKSGPERRETRSFPARWISDDRAATYVKVLVSVRPTVALGFTPRFSAGAELGLAAREGPFSVGLAASAFIPRSMAFGEGSVSAWFVAARLSGCADFHVQRALELGACGAVLAARLSVRGEGYRLENGTALRPLWALGPEGRLSAEISRSSGFSAHGTLFFVPARESFSVEPTGRAFQVGPLAGWFGVGVWTKIQ